MKKFVYAVWCTVLAAMLLGGCGTKLDSDSNLVYVDKKGVVTAVHIEQMSQDYYDGTELEDFVKEAVDAYTEEYGRGSVKVEDFAIEGENAKYTMSYESAEDYANFNGIEIFAGTVVDSLAAGYVYEGSFVKVENGSKAETATKQDIYAEKELKVVIIREKTEVKVPGTICYVSSEYAELTGTDSVSIYGNGDSVQTDDCIYIVYK